MPAPTTIDAELREMLDVQQLRRLADDYAAAADGVDKPLFAALFTDDGVLEVQQAGHDGPLFTASGRDALLEVLDLLDPYLFTQHFVTNHRVTVDGDHATGEAYCIAHHVRVDDGRMEDMAQYIKYLDRYVRTTEGWRFARRHLVTRFLDLSDSLAAPPPLRAGSPSAVRPAEPRWAPGV